MSRNLSRTDCSFCHGVVVLGELPREITRDEAGVYYDTHEGYGYAGMVTANASCVDCNAKYLAWIDLTKCAGYGPRYLNRPNDDEKFIDLSYRSTFDDEPGPEDMPDEIIVRKEIVAERTPWPLCPGGCGAKAIHGERQVVGDYCPACRKKANGNGKCPWCPAHYSTEVELNRHLAARWEHLRERLAKAERELEELRGRP